MIRIAAGVVAPSPFASKKFTSRHDGRRDRGARLCRGPVPAVSCPSIGRLTRYRAPVGRRGIRIDTGVFEGAEISLHYDPMIAKLVASGPTRAAAVARLEEALDSFEITGLAHNIPFLAAVVATERFRAGAFTTGFIAEEFPAGFSGRAVDAADETQAIVVAAAARRIAAEHEATIGGQVVGRAQAVPEAWTVCRGEARYPVRTIARRRRHRRRPHGAQARRVVATAWQPGQTLLRAAIDGVPRTYQLARDGIGLRLSRGGWRLSLKVLTPRAAELLKLMPKRAQADLSHLVLSPMPGLVVSIAVVVGQEVKAGDEIAVIEAMKMENRLRAERDGTIAKIHAQPGDSLAADQIILEFA